MQKIKSRSCVSSNASDRSRPKGHSASESGVANVPFPYKDSGIIFIEIVNM